MTDLILPDHVRETLQDARLLEAAEEARQMLWLWLHRAYQAGFELALKTPARLRGQVNLNASFGRWYDERIAPEPADG